MGEKRKVPPRERTGSAKRRISEVAATPAKKKSSTPLRQQQQQEEVPEPVEVIMPAKIKDGQPLPTLPKPQFGNLPSEEYQSYGER
jgi:hypothetical protein